jgi:hypothetical protein
MGSMVGTGRSARLIRARDKLDIDRFGSIASVWLRAGHFRSSTNNGHHQTALVCLKGANRRHLDASSACVARADLCEEPAAQLVG